MPSTVGMLVPQDNTNGVTWCGGNTQDQKGYMKILFFKHKYITNPTATSEDAVVQEAKELTQALKGNLPTFLGKSVIDQLQKLDAIFNETAEKYKKREQK